MKKIASMVAAVTALAALTACDAESVSSTAGSTSSSTSSASQSASSETTAVAVEAAAPTQEMTEEEMKDEAMRLVYEEEGIYMSASDQRLTGQTVCQFVREGNSVDQLFLEIAMNPSDQVLPTVSNDDLPYVVGVSIARYCPEYEYVLD